MTDGIEMRLRKHPEQVARLRVLKERINAVEADSKAMETESKNSYIQGESLKSSLGLGGEGLSSTNLSNPTERIALDIYTRTKNSIELLQREAEKLSRSISATTYALNALPERTRYVLEQRYFQRKEWDDVLRCMANKYDVYSRRTMFRYHREGIAQIGRTLNSIYGGWTNQKRGNNCYDRRA